MRVGKKARAKKLGPSADEDPDGPRLIPLKETDTPQGGLTGFNYVSLADTALKLWDTTDRKQAKRGSKAGE